MKKTVNFDLNSKEHLKLIAKDFFLFHHLYEFYPLVDKIIDELDKHKDLNFWKSKFNMKAATCVYALLNKNNFIHPDVISLKYLTRYFSTTTASIRKLYDEITKVINLQSDDYQVVLDVEVIGMNPFFGDIKVRSKKPFIPNLYAPENYCYTINLLLLGSDPVSDRELIVPANINLGLLENLIQIAFGFDGFHLSEMRKGIFTFNPNNFDDSFALLDYTYPGPDFTYVAGVIETYIPFYMDDFSVFDLLKFEGDNLLYTYDFGDNWQVLVKVKKIREEENEKIRFTKVRGFKIIEDIGGIFTLNEIIANPKSLLEFGIVESKKQIKAVLDEIKVSAYELNSRIKTF